MHAMFRAANQLDVKRICLLDYGSDALTDAAKTLTELQEALTAKGDAYGDNLPEGLTGNNLLFGGRDLAQAFNNLSNWSRQQPPQDRQSYKGNVGSAISQINVGIRDAFKWCDLFAVGPSCEHLTSKLASTDTALRIQSERIEKLFAESKTNLTDQMAPIQEMLDEAKGLAQKVKVGELENIYWLQAAFHKGLAKRWLGGAVGSAIGLIVLALVMAWANHQDILVFEKDQNHWLSTLLFAVAVIPVLAVLGVGNLCMKRASAHSHLATVYDHKASIAQAFIWMTATEKAPELRAEWMRSIVEGLVSFESSGFLGKESGTAPQPVTMQVIREAAKFTGAEPE